MNVGLSLGGIAIAGVIIWANLRPWLKAGANPKALLPFGTGSLLGALGTICVGGLLGWGTAGIAGLLSRAGNTAVSKTVGTSAASVAHGSMGHLTPQGGVVVFMLFAGAIVLYRASGKADRKRILGGPLCGALLGFLPGVATAFGWLPEAVNSLGLYVAAGLGSAL